MKQINKAAARKLYSKGKVFWMTACNMRPECGLLVNARVYDPDHYLSIKFDDLHNCYCYYNCDKERGRYPRFYVEEGE